MEGTVQRGKGGKGEGKGCPKFFENNVGSPTVLTMMESNQEEDQRKMV